jgi:putative copper resistance protein D
MIAHFLISGYLFVQSLVGIDPVPCAALPVPAAHAHRCDGDARVLRHLDHDVVGPVRRRVVRLDGAHVGRAPLVDQYTGGGIAWSIGEIPTLILAITVAIQWSRTDERAQRRGDRHADPHGDAELERTTRSSRSSRPATRGKPASR